MTQITRILWIDYWGVLRCKAVPTPRLGQNARIVTCGMVLSIWGGIAEGSTGGPSGEVTLFPGTITYDSILSSNFRRLLVPWHPTHQMMFADLHDEYGKPWLHCPRRCLRTALSLLKEYDLRPQAGFELEFALVKEDTQSDSMTFFGDQKTLVFASAQMLDIAADVLDEMINMITMMDINVTLVQAECGLGQYEIVLEHCEVMQAVENAIVAREAIKAVARKHGLRATFAPVYGGGLGNGGHIHLSLDHHFGTDDLLPCAIDGKDFKIGVDQIGQQFLAGIVDALPWLTFPCNSSPLSYKRMQPGTWSGAFKAWGYNNKETPVRLVQDRSNVEIKFADGISNTFHSVAAILTAGAIGVQNEMKLPNPCQIDPQHAKDKSLYPLLPSNVEEAMEVFTEEAKRNEVLTSVFPKEVVQDWVAIRREEVKFISLKGEDVHQKVIQTIF